MRQISIVILLIVVSLFVGCDRAPTFSRSEAVVYTAKAERETAEVALDLARPHLEPEKVGELEKKIADQKDLKTVIDGSIEAFAAKMEDSPTNRGLKKLKALKNLQQLLHTLRNFGVGGKDDRGRFMALVEKTEANILDAKVQYGPD